MYLSHGVHIFFIDYVIKFIRKLHRCLYPVLIDSKSVGHMPLSISQLAFRPQIID